MKRFILTTAIGILTITAWSQDNTQQKQQKDQNKTEMQSGDTKKKKTTTHKAKKTNDERKLKMDNYPSNKQGSSDPAEQKQMDTTLNNHR